MGFKHFNLQLARGRVLSAPSNNKKNLDRRKFFRSVGLGALALAPVMGSIRKALSAPFEMERTASGFTVRRNGSVAWQFPARIFEKGSAATVTAQADSYHIEALNISLAGTGQPFSLSADIYHDGLRWMMKFRIPEFGLDSETEFIPWLDGEDELCAKANIPFILGSADSNNSLQFNEQLMLGIDPRWNFSFTGKDAIILQSDQHHYTTDQLLLTYNGRKSRQAGITAPAHALLAIAPAFAGWRDLINSIKIAGENTLCPFGGNPALNLLFWNDRTDIPHQLLWAANNNGGIEFRNGNHDSGAFKLHKYFILTEIFNRGYAQTYLAASVRNEGEWYSNGIGSFLLGSESDIPDFEAIGSGNRLDNYRFSPLLIAFRPSIENAITLTTVNPKPLRISIAKNISDPGNYSLIEIPVATPDTIIRKKTTISPVKITPPAQKADTPVRTIKIEPQKAEPAKETPQPARQTEPAKKETVKQPAIEIDRDKIVLKPATLKFRILRPEDMLILDFSFQNFKLTGTGTETSVALADNTKNGTMTVWFQTQHTLEEAFYEANNVKDDEKNPSSYAEVDIPARHLRAHRSRLVFEYKAGSPAFRLSIEELLNWSRFDLKVHPRAWVKLPSVVDLDPSGRIKKVSPLKLRSAPAVSLEKPEKQYSLKLVASSRKVSSRFLIYDEGNMSKLFSPEIAESVKKDYKIDNLSKYLNAVDEIPDASTSIEAPALLYISPNQLAGFMHKLKAESRAATEKAEVLRSQVSDPLSGAKGEITELWHTALGVKLKDGKVSDDLPALTTIRALWAYDANSRMESMPGRNQPFMASLDANNRHKLVHTTSNYNITGYSPKAVPVNKLMLTSLGAYLDLHALFDVPSPADDILNIIEWQHFATLGRDHYVKVVEEGYLFPFGHKAAIVKITERKFEKTKKAAVNRQRMFIVVIEKEVLYDRSDPNNKFISFPFQAVRIETASTPNIDNPADSTIITVPPPGGPNPKNKEKINTSYNFYIKVNKEPFNFDITTTDKEGNEQKIRMPLAFLENFIARHEKYPLDILKDYNEKQPKLNTVQLNRQKTAFAENLLDNDTTFETGEMSFGAITYPSTGAGSIRFHPVIQWAEVYIDQVNQLTNNNDPVKIGLVDDANAGHVFASVIGSGMVDFSGGSDKTGGFLSPSMQITALSRLQGPVGGAVEDISNMVFKASEFFMMPTGTPVAKIFGVIDIFSLFGAGKSLKGSLDAYISNINNIRRKIEEYKNDLMLLEAKARETGENIASQAQQIKNNIASQVKELMDTLNNSIPRIPNFKTYTTEEAVNVEYKWIPELESKLITVYPGLLAVRVDNPGNALSVNTRFSKPFDSSQSPSFTSEARFEKFGIQIANMIEVNFNYMKYSGGTGKSDVKVDLGPGIPIKFMGTLGFVNNLQSIIPKTGFSDDGPYIELTPRGVKAGFTISVPNIAVGVCMITNISLGAFVDLPFTGDPLTVGFNFCTRENPFLLTVSCFGGGGFFQLITRLDGIQSIEAAFEFGAAVSLDVGVASGGVQVMGGFYYKSTFSQKKLTNPDRTIDVTETEISGYMRINGHLSILGLIHVSLEFYICLTAKIENNKVRKLEGSATLKVKVEVLFFSKTVSVTVHKQLAGNDGDPTFKEMVEADDWQQYCLAFANE